MSGVFGVVSKGDCSEILLYGTDYHSHLGTEFGGMAILGETFQRQIHNISYSQFKSKFYEDTKCMTGKKGIGVISDSNEQPMYINSKFGPFCIVTSGLIENSDELANKLMQQGHSFSEMSKSGVNVTELIAKIITVGSDIINGIEKVFEAIEGSCSMLLLHKDGIYAARDKRGYTPLIIGSREDAYAVTSETSAFTNIGFKTEKFLEPGEIVLISEDGLVQKKQGESINQVCTFLWIYAGFPASDYEGINTEVVRERCGKSLARRDKDIEVDVVAGIPDSGLAHAIGYAMESGKPYRRPLVKYTPGYGRSYTPPLQEKRDLIATMKLIPIKEIIDGNRIVICEDSIVRGTQLKNFTINKLKQCGAKEIHVRSACPPLLYPCKFCLSTRTIHELVARKAIRSIEGQDIADVSEYIDPTTEKHKKMVEWITEDIKATTIRYQTLEDMLDAVGLPEDKVCTYCWTGKCPSKNTCTTAPKQQKTTVK
ncbi:MAG: amidophosphoribosyltransferase [Candidatus Ancaeobacter aquaticus]|nr:amidophosphoribosyltransferase [Candidatus Ancaeobacter aquaticus]